jgi:hypothetical protein
MLIISSPSTVKAHKEEEVVLDEETLRKLSERRQRAFKVIKQLCLQQFEEIEKEEQNECLEGKNSFC